MDKEQLHKCVENSTGNESNICQIYAAIGDSGNIIYINKEVNVSVGITGTFKPRIFDRVEFIEQKILPVFL